MIRLIFAAIYAFLSVVLLYPYHIYLWLLSKKDQKKSWNKSWKIVRSFFKGVLNIAGTKVEVRGAENLEAIPKDQGVLFIGNHRSFFDVIILQTIVDRPMGFIAKSDFKKVPLFSSWVMDIGSIFMDRKDVRAGLESIKTGTDYISKGLSLGLYPEGTRSHTKELLPFKKGGYRMAKNSESPIVLVAATGTDDIFENNKPIALRKKKVIFEFSEAYYPHKMDKDTCNDFYEEIPGKLKEMLDTH
ncbi:1-acyl-sn-glycerol-3-phosphate acyltransferase [Lachnospiraceae bacterium NE2001]|nr:1-acyl-sn-glycerol-3-phosphate acyltransferase [Lachnospiraceae bacterium NE2001]